MTTTTLIQCPKCGDNHHEPQPICTRYNGWTNYETWCVNLWLTNEEGSYNYWRGIAQLAKQTGPYNENVPKIWTAEEASRFTLADQLKEEVTADAGEQATMFGDLLRAALSEVNWEEIAQSFLDVDGE